ncbi:hypothetical protein TMatcc_003577 [Talaromyces marneffei ATCC 18224]|uniref:Azaphilone pigments biosynthesis cluster protein L N-terminal domain-containing protein n=1 Tax=Talaromyces marneffei (strain ATCC 18224 / CBS 334.59 / QM 7333) TaxID=441960 RepID=B6Q3M9_TALMQ|nr:hypothetical protein PMAA_029360 [Talaromyces marneffei ATCC 18224]KAE8556239.1 hypothetical protein EYB25_000939 [Talaromyces marneffei]
MDPLSVTASAIAIAALAAQSCKQTYSLISGITDAPQSITHSQNLLIQTEDSLVALEQLVTNNKTSAILESTLRAISLERTLKSTRDICSDFSAAVANITKHSTDTKFSFRDRISVHLREGKINGFNQQLSDCRRTLVLVLGSINLILSSRTSEDIERLKEEFQAQETALWDLNTQLRNQLSLPVPDTETKIEQNSDLSLTLQDLCKETLAATEAKRTGQRFGDMLIEDRSMAMQGIVGNRQEGVEQTFGKLTATKESRAFQGQMSSEAFAAMFGGRSST